MPPKKPIAAPSKKKRNHITLVLYGPSGSGKTSFAAQFPKPGFICDSQEKGIVFLQRNKLVPSPVWIDCDLEVDSPSTWKKLLKRVWDACNDNTIETLVLESVTGLENICFVYHCEAHFDGDFSKTGFYSHWQGPKNAARFDWPELITALDAVYESGKNVIVTAHSQSKEEPDPMGTAVMKYVPYCEKDTWARLHRWASGVFFFGRRIEEDKKKGGNRKVAKPEFDRILFVDGTPYCDAKNWFGLEGVIPLGDSAEEGFKSFVSKMGNKW